jgi:hypothetical protein
MSNKIKRERNWREREYGIITPFVMKLFRIFQFLPFQVFYGNKTDHYFRDLKGKTKQQRAHASRKRALYMDIIIISYLVFEILLPYIYENYYHHLWLKYTITTILAFRLIDIIQVNVNMILFDTIA